MDRRNFIKNISLGVGGIALLSAIGSCVSDDITELFSEPRSGIEEEIIEYVKKGYTGKYEDYSEIFYQKRKVIIADRVEIADDKEAKWRKVDYVLLVHAYGVISCDYDFYKENNSITEIEEKGINGFKLKLNDSNSNIIYTQFKELSILKFPLKIKDRTQFIFEEKYKIPCIMTKESFNRYFNINSTTRNNCSRINLFYGR